MGFESFHGNTATVRRLRECARSGHFPQGLILAGPKGAGKYALALMLAQAVNCLENAGRQKASVYQRCILYSTLSPCPMCSGAALLYKIPHIIVGENVTFQGPEAYVRSQGGKVEILQNEEYIQLMRDFIAARPELWNEDIGV